MSETGSEFLRHVATESQERLQAFGRLFASADSSKVFGQPVTSGSYTVIAASEVAGGGGFGSGTGLGPTRARGGQPAQTQAGSAEGALEGAGSGGGGGGGGFMGRPVAAIIIGPEGVEVKPVLDFTKLGIAALSVLAAMVALAPKLLKKR